MRRYRVANTPPEKRKYLRKSQLWSQDFTAKLFCNVEFWMERLPKLIGLCESTSIAIPNSGLDPFSDFTTRHLSGRSVRVLAFGLAFVFLASWMTTGERVGGKFLGGL
jgi:hypothetical protein